MYKWFLNRGPNCTTQNHNTQGRPNGHLRSHPTQSPRARDTHPLDQRSQLTVEPPDGLGGGVIINAKVFRDRVHGNATSAHLSRVRSDPLVHRHRGRDQTRSTSTDSQAKVRMFSCRVHHSNPPVFSSLETTKPVRRLIGLRPACSKERARCDGDTCALMTRTPDGRLRIPTRGPPAGAEPAYGSRRRHGKRRKAPEEPTPPWTTPTNIHPSARPAGRGRSGLLMSRSAHTHDAPTRG